MTPEALLASSPHRVATAIHLVLHGKGGIGKTVVALLIAQYLRERGSPALCWDADPVNASLSAFPALMARRFEPTDDNNFPQRNFDHMIDTIIGQDDDAVVDIGSSAFIPFCQYVADHDIPGVLAATGRTLTIHTIARGGPDESDTLIGIDAVARLAPPGIPIVIWLNEFFGSITGGIENSGVYQTHRDRILGLVRLPDYNPKTFGRDLTEMLSRRLTFAEAVHPQTRHFYILEKQRLVMIRRDIFRQLQLFL